MTDVLIDTSAGVMTITLNRVEKKNSLTSAMYAAMADALEQANADANVRAVVFQGHETIFSAGNDIGDFLNAPAATNESPVFRFLRGISTFPKPVVAAVCCFIATWCMRAITLRFPCLLSTSVCVLKRPQATWHPS